MIPKNYQAATSTYTDDLRRLHILIMQCCTCCLNFGFARVEEMTVSPIATSTLSRLTKRWVLTTPHLSVT